METSPLWGVFRRQPPAVAFVSGSICDSLIQPVLMTCSFSQQLLAETHLGSRGTEEEGLAEALLAHQACPVSVLTSHPPPAHGRWVPSSLTSDCPSRWSSVLPLNSVVTVPSGGSVPWKFSRMAYLPCGVQSSPAVSVEKLSWPPLGSLIPLPSLHCLLCPALGLVLFFSHLLPPTP